MDYKVFDTPYGQVLLRRDYTYVHIEAYIDDYIDTEEIIFKNKSSAQFFIKNYSLASAEKWLYHKQTIS